MTSSKQKTLISLLLIALGNNGMAAQSMPSVDLSAAREQIIHQYINDLGAANDDDVSALFAQNGVVVSTSRGTVNAADFFHSFLPNIGSATTEFHQAFIGHVDPNRYAARFHFRFALKDGETGDGEYVDEFLFADNSSKLLSVYMFENLLFQVNQ